MNIWGVTNGGAGRAALVSALIVQKVASRVWPTSLPAVEYTPLENRPFNYSIQGKVEKS